MENRDREELPTLEPPALPPDDVLAAALAQMLAPADRLLALVGDPWEGRR